MLPISAITPTTATMLPIYAIAPTTANAIPSTCDTLSSRVRNTHDTGDAREKWTAQMEEDGCVRESEMERHITWKEFCDTYDMEPEEVRLWYKVEGQSECILREKEDFERMVERVQATESKIAMIRHDRDDEWESPK
jgi:hypothetical protein